MGKHIYAPHIKNLNEIFTGFEYGDKGGAGSYYITSPLSKHIGTHTYDAKRDVVKIHKARFCSLRGTGIKQEIRDLIEPHMIGYFGSFEIVKRSTGEYLVIVRDNEGIGQRWICELPADYDLMQHVSPEARAMIEASEASFAEAIKDAPDGSAYKTESYRKARA